MFREFVKSHSSNGVKAGLISLAAISLPGIGVLTQREVDSEASFNLAAMNMPSVDVSTRQLSRRELVELGLPGIEMKDDRSTTQTRSTAENYLLNMLKESEPFLSVESFSPLEILQYVMSAQKEGLTFDDKTLDAFRTVANEYRIAQQTVESISFLLAHTSHENIADRYLVQLLAALNARAELLNIARFHPEEVVAEEAMNSLSGDFAEVAEWLRSERRALRSNLQGNSEEFLERQLLLEQALASTVLELEDNQRAFDEYEDRLEGAQRKIEEFERRQDELQTRLKGIQESLAAYKDLVDALNEAEKKREQELRKLHDSLLKTWQSQHITVKGKTYKVVRQASGSVRINTHSRNTNFDLIVNEGDKVLFVVTDKGMSDAAKGKIKFRLKRDKRNAGDKDVRKDLRHGDVWTGENYVSNGTRFYVRHEGNKNVHGRFYVVSRADSKPTFKYSVSSETKKKIEDAKRRIRKLEQDAESVSAELSTATPK